MSYTKSTFLPDGSCQLIDEIEATETVWASVTMWAGAWLAEWRANEHGSACAFIGTACDDAVAGVVDALVVLAETADDDEELAWVGAGPLEDLVSHSEMACGCLLMWIEPLGRTWRSVPR